MDTLPLFPVDHLTVALPVIEPVADEPELPPLTVIPGQLDLFTGEAAS